MMGLACCAIEMMATAASRFDLARFGAELFRPSPRQADLMIVSGRLCLKMMPVAKRLYDQMPEPKWVIAMGACASTSGVFSNYAVINGVDKILPVDVYIPGCPPSPDAFMEGLLLLSKAVGQEKRPLSWVVGPQGVYRPEMPVMRDEKHAQRQQETELRSPDGI
jgi:NADH-quinone oxidoreductase subunit B